MSVSSNKKIMSVLLAVGALTALSACGGGGADGQTLFGTSTPTPTPSSPTPIPTPAPTPTPSPLPTLPPNAQHVSLQTDCSGQACGATDSNTVVQGLPGVWKYANTGTDPVSVDIAITGTNGRTGTLVVSNTSASPVSMYDIPGTLTTSAQHIASADISPLPTPGPASTLKTPPPNQVPDKIRNFVAPKVSTLAATQKIQAQQRTTYNVGDTRNWFDADGNVVAATMIQQFTTASDNRPVYFWVQNSEFGTNSAIKVTAADIQAFGTRFANSTTVAGNDSIYAMDTSLAGMPWGAVPASLAATLIPAVQPINVVIANLTPDGEPFGLVGYFYSQNNQLNSTLPVGKQFSNESLVFFMDSETIYDARTGFNPSGMDFELSTLAHEFTHMINYYQRGVLLDSTNVAGAPSNENDAWLEEMTAMGMEDIVDSHINPTYDAIRASRFPDWLTQGGYNCPLDVFDGNTEDTCFSYSIGGSFMGYLIRQYGVANFYQPLLADHSSSDSYTRLDNVIQQAATLTPGTPVNLADALRHWHSSVSLFSLVSPQGFGYPIRAETVSGIPYALPTLATTSNMFSNDRDAGMPIRPPVTLAPHALHPALRKNLGSTWTESVALPPNTTLTVVVQ